MVKPIYITLYYWWKCKLVQPLWRTVRSFLKILKTEHPYHPAISLLGIYAEKTMIQKDTCTLMFIAALFTIAKTWKQSKCLSTDQWVKKMWYIYTMEYYSAIKKKWNNAICSNRNGVRDYHTKWSKSEKDKHHVIPLMWNLKKNDANELRLTDSETKLMDNEQERCGGIN